MIHESGLSIFPYSLSKMKTKKGHHPKFLCAPALFECNFSKETL